MKKLLSVIFALSLAVILVSCSSKPNSNVNSEQTNVVTSSSIVETTSKDSVESNSNVTTSAIEDTFTNDTVQNPSPSPAVVPKNTQKPISLTPTPTAAPTKSPEPTKTPEPIKTPAPTPVTTPKPTNKPEINPTASPDELYTEDIVVSGPGTENDMTHVFEYHGQKGIGSCPECGATWCSECGSDSHTKHPTCTVCNGYDHTNSAHCGVCGTVNCRRECVHEVKESDYMCGHCKQIIKGVPNPNATPPKELVTEDIVVSGPSNAGEPDYDFWGKFE